MGRHASRSGNPLSGLFGLLLILASGAVTASALTLCDSEVDQLLYVSIASVAAFTGWVMQSRHGKTRV